MKALAVHFGFCLVVGYCLAAFLVLLFNHWYFAQGATTKSLMLALPVAAAYLVLTYTKHGRLWRMFGYYWIFAYLIAALAIRGLDLSGLSFTSVLNYEAAVIWVPVIVLTVVVVMGYLAASAQNDRLHRAVTRQLALRQRIRQSKRRAQSKRISNPGGTVAVVIGLLICLCAVFSPGQGYAQKAHTPNWVLGDRHDDLKQPVESRKPGEEPIWPLGLPLPMHQRYAETYYIYIENVVDGRIAVCNKDDFSLPENWEDAGKVLAPVANINKEGFTASGWAEPGTVCATAVNAMHIKTDHDYATGRGVIFSLVPIEFADFDPANYTSYFNQSSTLFTDITAGTEIFGGKWAPLTGSELLIIDDEWSAETSYSLPFLWSLSYAKDHIRPVGAGYVPKVGDKLVISYKRRQYNPEYIQFDNNFGGLIWIKELGMEPYPIGQVLKPVAGVGRFEGTLYTEVGRIRAAHPGVIDISTSPYGVIGGFQIIPRDHAMSPEMTYTRTKTQWMVVGPLWALDESWEGLPPLFSDYLYPCFTPAMNPDGTVNEDIDGAAAFLDRFTVRGRYSDADDPEEYILLREYTMLDNAALQELTHVRIYFPRN